MTESGERVDRWSWAEGRGGRSAGTGTRGRRRAGRERGWCAAAAAGATTAHLNRRPPFVLAPAQAHKLVAMFGLPMIPPELWLEVLGHLSYYDLKLVVRLVCKAFGQLVAHPTLNHAMFRCPPENAGSTPCSSRSATRPALQARPRARRARPQPLPAGPARPARLGRPAPALLSREAARPR